MFLLSFLAAKKNNAYYNSVTCGGFFDCRNSFVICLKHFFQMIVTLS